MDALGMGKEKLLRVTKELRHAGVLSTRPRRISNGLFRGYEWLISPTPFEPPDESAAFSSPDSEINGQPEARKTGGRITRPPIRSLKNSNLEELAEEEKTSKPPKGVLESKDLIADSPKLPEKRGSRLSPDWTPSEKLLDWAKTRVRGIDLALETEMFVNHFVSATGRGSTKRNWDRAWQNWMLNNFKRQPLARRVGNAGFNATAAEEAIRRLRDFRTSLNELTE